jgi:flagellar assembly protein FliH
MSSCRLGADPRPSAVISRGTGRVQTSPFAALCQRQETPANGRVLVGEASAPSLWRMVASAGTSGQAGFAQAPGQAPSADVNRGEELLIQARRDAAEIIVRAREEAQTVREQAAAAGREEGYRAGMEGALAQIGESVGALAAMAERASLDYRSLLLTAEKQVSEIAVAVARKVLERELQADDYVILNIVRAALHEVEDVRAARVRVRVSPNYLPVISTYWQQDGANVEFVGDADLALGDCLIESESFGLDGRIETRLAELIDTFGATAEQRRVEQEV